MREVARNLPEGHQVQVQVIMSLSGIEAIAGTEPRLQGSARQLEELGFYVGRKE